MLADFILSLDSQFNALEYDAHTSAAVDETNYEWSPLICTKAPFVVFANRYIRPNLVVPTNFEQKLYTPFLNQLLNNVNSYPLFARRYSGTLLFAIRTMLGRTFSKLPHSSFSTKVHRRRCSFCHQFPQSESLVPRGPSQDLLFHDQSSARNLPQPSQLYVSPLVGSPHSLPILRFSRTLPPAIPNGVFSRTEPTQHCECVSSSPFYFTLTREQPTVCLKCSSSSVYLFHCYGHVCTST
ncbi:hypothetical protein BLNAU_15957 [Blattamonas nauphoetae]|uniref:Uncharacterized protein n=1 Tax=Blattamonas nauphoetae TaxID=2049346 RepID=A0ABQ9X965_9EUKA|nr:hypothetical protein BLNAU_15957 [Blattamonas nauphoetae]